MSKLREYKMNIKGTWVDPEKGSIVFVTRALSAPFSLRDLITYCEQHGIECRVLSELSFQKGRHAMIEPYLHTLTHTIPLMLQLSGR